MSKMDSVRRPLVRLCSGFAVIAVSIALLAPCATAKITSYRVPGGIYFASTSLDRTGRLWQIDSREDDVPPAGTPRGGEPQVIRTWTGIETVNPPSALFSLSDGN